MSRTMLLVNESQLLRKIITGYVMSEITDMNVEAAWSSEEALKLMNQKRYDAVLSAMEMSGRDGVELYRQLRRSELNADTPFVIMTSTATDAQRARLASEGIRHVLFAPYSADQLARMLNEACDPRHQRQHARYSIQGAEALIYMGKHSFTIRIINISQNGILGDLEYDDALMVPWRAHVVDVLFPDEYGGQKAEDIRAVALRAAVMAWRTEEVPETLRIAWKFVSVPEGAESTIREALTMAQKEHQEAESLSTN